MDNKKRQRPRGKKKRAPKRERPDDELSTFPAATIKEERSHKCQKLDRPPRTREEESHRVLTDYVPTTKKPLLPYKIPPIEDCLRGTTRQVIAALYYLAKKVGSKYVKLSLLMSKHDVTKSSLEQALQKHGADNKTFKRLFDMYKLEFVVHSNEPTSSRIADVCGFHRLDGCQATLINALLDRDA